MRKYRDDDYYKTKQGAGTVTGCFGWPVRKAVAHEMVVEVVR